MKSNQINALRSAAEKKRETSIKNLNEAILKMQHEGLPISIGSVATCGGVARSWIYSNPEIKAIIDINRKGADKITRILDLRSQLDTRDKKIIALKQRNKALSEKIKKLRKQLEEVYGQLYVVASS